ncbi:hypothetical protein B9Z55_010323 [Caenorhabditis nigoni]|uniref:Uncharacterized protein n=1 Tax=Caenorhabditis nigoni TaxID=1611254 RepID=A0A2G5UFD7_9PELO|nr:hypothetical protein B9Z55_010323 [Caenorhabditis nigoni]
MINLYNNNVFIGRNIAPSSTTSTTTLATTTTVTTTTTITTTTSTTTTELPTTTESYLSTVIAAVFILFAIGACSIGAYFAYKYFFKVDKTKSVPSNGKIQKKRAPQAKKKVPKKPKKSFEEEKSSTIEYEEKKHFSGILVNV